MTLSSCGYSSKQNELIGQVKKVKHETPIFCRDRTDVDISLGVMRNGVGSMSSEDKFLTVTNPDDVRALIKANESGALVKVTYDEARLNFCYQTDIVTKVELAETK